MPQSSMTLRRGFKFELKNSMLLLGEVHAGGNAGHST